MRSRRPNRRYPTHRKEYTALKKRFSELRNKVCVMEHYWRKRCKERNVLSMRLWKLHNEIKRVQHLERVFAQMLNRKYIGIQTMRGHLSKKEKQAYPLFLTHNDGNRLRNFIQRNLYDMQYIKRKRGKTVPHLTPKDYMNLKNLLKRIRKT